MSSSIPLLIAGGAVGFLHSILPGHWLPLAVIGRTRRWSTARVARVSFLTSVGHVLTSLLIAAIIAAVGIQFRSTFETQQGHIVGIILILTGVGFLVWALMGGGHHHDHQHHEHDQVQGPDDHHDHAPPQLHGCDYRHVRDPHRRGDARGLSGQGGLTG